MYRVLVETQVAAEIVYIITELLFVSHLICSDQQTPVDVKATLTEAWRCMICLSFMN